MSDTVADRLEAGVRVARFVIFRDVEGRTHAVAAGTVAAICDGDDGALLLLPGGRIVQVLEGPWMAVVRWPGAGGDGACTACREMAHPTYPDHHRQAGGDP